MAYTTVKVVAVDDVCLGLLHYIFMALIFVYIIMYQVFYSNAYVDLEVPVGTVRMSLQGPTDESGGFPCDPQRPEPHCNYDFTPVEDIPYCTQSGNVIWEKQVTNPCRCTYL